MTFDIYKKLLISSMEKDYHVETTYLGEEYEIAGISRTDGDFETREICLVSFNSDEMYVRSEIERLPEIVLSGLRSFSRNRKSVVLRAFIMENVSFELIQEIRSYKFSRAVKGQFWGYAETQIIIVDIAGDMVYSNLAGENKKDMFIFTGK